MIAIMQLLKWQKKSEMAALITGAISHAKTIDDILSEANTYLGTHTDLVVLPEVE